MNRHLAGLAVTATFTSCLVLTCSSCTVLNPVSEPSAISPYGDSAPSRHRLVQLHFGREASFGLCAEPACPRVTPKTLAVTAAVTLPVALREAQAPTFAAIQVSDAMRLVSSPQSPEPPSPPASGDIADHRVVVNFSFASATLTETSKTALSASLGHARKSEAIIISGRTDVVGDAEANEALALSRAVAVRNFFRDLAPDLAAAITIDAKGRCCFVAANADEDGRARNRRVEVVFTARGGA